MVVGRADVAYRKVKATFRETKKSKGGNINSATGIPLVDAGERADRWKEYSEGIYEGEDLPDDVIEEEIRVDREEIGDPILESEFNRALEDLGSNRGKELTTFQRNFSRHWVKWQPSDCSSWCVEFTSLEKYHQTLGKMSSTQSRRWQGPISARTTEQSA